SRATAASPAERVPSARALYEVLESYLAGDRDLERRGALAEQSAAAAMKDADIAVSESDPGNEARGRAMRSLGHALALDPSNALALHTMARLLAHPPRSEPAEAAEEIEKEEQEAIRVT